MRKLMIAGVILLILSGTLALALLNLNRLVAHNKDYLLAQVEQALGRKVTVEEVGLTLWGGIGMRLQNFALADDQAFSSGDFARAADLQVNVKFLPLLWQELRVTRLILHRPVITVIRDKKGQFNFASLGSAEKDKTDKEAEAAAPPAATAALPLLVSLVDVANGEVHYRDKKDGVDLGVSQLDFTVEGVGFDGPISINIAVAVFAEQQNLKIQGQIGPLDPTLDFNNVPVEAQVEIDPLNIDNLAQAFPQIKTLIPEGLGLSGPLQVKTNISGRAGALTLSKAELTATVFAADTSNFKLTGQAGPLGGSLKNLSLSIDIKMGPVELANLRKFAPLAETLPADLNANGPLSLSVHAEGTPENVALTGTLEATASTLSLGTAFYKPQGVPLFLSTDARVTKKAVNLQQAKIQLHTLELTGSGEISQGKTPLLNLKVDSGQTELAGWEQIIPLLQGYDLSGGLEVHARIQGKMDKLPTINGSLSLAGVGAVLPSIPKPITDLNANISFTGDQAELAETTLNLGNSQIHMSAQVQKFTPPTLTYRLSAPDLWLADLQASNSASSSAGKRAEVLQKVKSQGRIGMKNGSLSYQGSFSSAQGTVSDIDYTDLQTAISLTDQVATIKDLKLRVFDGLFQANGRYNLRESPPQFTLAPRIQGLNLTQFFRIILSAAQQHIQGRANLGLQLAGSGEEWRTIEPSLRGKGRAVVVQGALLNINIAEGVLSGVTGIPGLSLLVSPRVRDKYPEIFATQNTNFDQLKGTVTISNGKVHIDDLVVAAVDWTMRGKGWFGFDQTLDFRARLTMSQGLSNDIVDDIKEAKYIVNNQGRLEIPFALAGTLPRVKPKPDLAYVGQLLQRAALRRGVEELEKGVLQKFFPPTSQPAEKEQSSRTSPSATPGQEKKSLEEELIRKGLDRLFGR